jgi:hypothetical protein
MSAKGRGIAAGALYGLAVIAAGCADLEQRVGDVMEVIRILRGEAPAPAPPSPPPAEEIPAPAAAGLTLRGSCVGKEQTGYAENVHVDIVAGQVRALDARVDIPKRGSCRFALADFRQTRQTPHVELLSRTNPLCAVRVWQQRDRITLAVTDCPEKCTGGAFEYMWPVEFNTAGGCY